MEKGAPYIEYPSISVSSSSWKVARAEHSTSESCHYNGIWAHGQAVFPSERFVLSVYL